jgi:hypothetical protein
VHRPGAIFHTWTRCSFLLTALPSLAGCLQLRQVERGWTAIILLQCVSKPSPPPLNYKLHCRSNIPEKSLKNPVFEYAKERGNLHLIAELVSAILIQIVGPIIALEQCCHEEEGDECQQPHAGLVEWYASLQAKLPQRPLPWKVERQAMMIPQDI